ncbi:MAG: DNA-3-methyladenine glycosylase, partial [Acidobacteria bacterium]|nr:DNA-3-methyladenine glycosylase [Acidobacteriota bacterium]
MGRFPRRSFYRRPVLEVARDLLGMTLVREVRDGKGATLRLAGRIVEVEAYDGESDLACHASKGFTKRTEPMFGEAGHAYIYLVYGMHCCLNVVTGPVGYPAAVLIRAVEPLAGCDRAGRVRARPRQIASGPGKLTRAFRIDLSLNRVDLCDPGPLYIERGQRVPGRLIVRGPRIGVEYAGAWSRQPWRFGVRGSASLSRPFPDRR